MVQVQEDDNQYENKNKAQFKYQIVHNFNQYILLNDGCKNFAGGGYNDYKIRVHIHFSYMVMFSQV